MRIAITTTENDTNWPMLFDRPMGSGAIRQNLLAREIAKLGHSVDFWTADSMSGEWEGVHYTNKKSVQENGKYDIVIANREPKAARWPIANRRIVRIQDASHWQPPPANSLDGIDLCLPVGETLYQLFAAVFPRNKLRCMGNTIHDEFISIDETLRNPQSICFSATPTPSSGLVTALKAVGLLKRKDVEFHVYGSAECWYGNSVKNGIAFTDEYQTRIDECAAEIAGDVIFHGAIPWPTMAQEYTKHAILIHPKTHETFGCSVAEAMWTRTIPIVASERALRERVSPQVSGLWAMWNRPDDFAKKLAWLLDNKEERQKMADRAHDAASVYINENMMKKWEEILANGESS